MPIHISHQTKRILLNALNLGHLVEIIDKDYTDIDEKNDIDHKKAVRYAGRNRGSVRINTGRFYTMKEYSDRILRAKKLKLP